MKTEDADCRGWRKYTSWKLFKKYYAWTNEMRPKHPSWSAVIALTFAVLAMLVGLILLALTVINGHAIIKDNKARIQRQEQYDAAICNVYLVTQHQITRDRVLRDALLQARIELGCPNMIIPIKPGGSIIPLPTPAPPTSSTH